MSKKGKNKEQDSVLKEIAKLLSRWVKSGSKSNLPVDKKTGELRPKGTAKGNMTQRYVENLVPEDLLPILQGALEDGKLPDALRERLRRLQRDIDAARRVLNMRERQDLDNRMQSTPNGKNIDTADFSDAMKSVAEAERQLRQELSTEILNAIEEAMEQQEQQQDSDAGEDGQENTQEAKDFEEGLDDFDEEDDGSQEGDGSDEGDESDGEGEGEGGGEDSQEAQAFEEGLDEVEAEGEVGEQAADGEEAAADGDKSFEVDGTIEVDESEVAQFIIAIESIMARQADNPDRLPRWNKRELTKRLTTFRNPLPARRPILQQQDVLFILDDSGSMMRFEKEVRALAHAIFQTARSGSKNSLVMTTTWNGIYGHGGKDVQYPREYWVNGELNGTLPDPSMHGEYLKTNDHARMWEWWLSEYLPKEHGIRPKMIIFFSDEHPAFQWNYLSNNMKGMVTIWMHPSRIPENSFTEEIGGVKSQKTGSAPEYMQEWTTDPWVKGDTTDSAFAATREEVSRISKTWSLIPVDFRCFRGYFFSGVNGISDVVEAIKRIASM